MPTPRRYASQAERQAAYRQRQEAARREALAGHGLPILPRVATQPGRARWRRLLRQAGLLLQAVQEEMEAYSEQRSEAWHASERGEAFQERLEGLREAQAAVEELGME